MNDVIGNSWTIDIFSLFSCTHTVLLHLRVWQRRRKEEETNEKKKPKGGSAGTNGLFSYLREHIITGLLHIRCTQTYKHWLIHRCGGGGFYFYKRTVELFFLLSPLFLRFFFVFSSTPLLSWRFVDPRSYCYQINFHENK